MIPLCVWTMEHSRAELYFMYACNGSTLNLINDSSIPFLIQPMSTCKGHMSPEWADGWPLHGVEQEKYTSLPSTSGPEKTNRRSRRGNSREALRCVALLCFFLLSRLHSKFSAQLSVIVPCFVRPENLGGTVDSNS